MNSTQNTQNTQARRTALGYWNGTSHSYDSVQATLARQEDLAWAERKQRLFGRDSSRAPAWLAAVVRALRGMGQSRVGFLFAWLDLVVFTVALHVVPALWIIDELFRKNHRESRAMFFITMRDLHQGPWYMGKRWLGLTGFFRSHRVLAAVCGTAIFILSSPMLIFSFPAVIALKIATRCSFKARLSLARIGH